MSDPRFGDSTTSLDPLRDASTRFKAKRDRNQFYLLNGATTDSTVPIGYNCWSWLPA